MVRPVVMLQGAIDNEGDARLIAAAPDLLCALRVILANSNLDLPPAERALATAAIAKATGEG